MGGLRFEYKNNLIFLKLDIKYIVNIRIKVVN
jgi:hypothetical protein